MFHRLSRRWMFAAATVLAAGVAMPSVAQQFPDKPIRLVITTPAGGPIDALARTLAEAAAKHLRQPVVVENKPGGSGAIGLGYTIKQPPDGYTVAITANAAFSLVPIVRKMPYRPLEDFTFLGQLAFTPNVFAVPAALPARSMKEFVALSKTQPGKLNYGMMPGIPQHLDFERFKKETASDIVMVPYTGGAPITNALLGGQIDATLFNAPLFSEWIKSGKVRVLATTARKRIGSMPEVPTLAEAGFSHLNLAEGSVYSLAAPAGLPAAVGQKLYQAFSAAASEPEVRKKLESIGFELSLRSGDALRESLRAEFAENEKLVKALDIKLHE